MALELIRDMLRFDQVVGEGQSQTLVDRDIIVSDIKPDIATILSVEGKINITSMDVEEEKMAVEGIVDFEILYSASEEPQPLYSMVHSANFSHYINIPKAMPKMEPKVKCCIEHIDFNKINGRKLNVQCVLNLNGKVVDRIPVDVVKEVAGIPDVQFLRDNVVTDEVIGEGTGQSMISGEIEIPNAYPEADEILKLKAMLHKKDVSIEDGKIVVSGSVLVPVLFSSKEEIVDIYKLEQDFVFTETIEIPGVYPGMSCNVDYTLEDVYADLKENEDDEKRRIKIEVVVGLKAKVYEKTEFPIIIDLYAPSMRIESEKQNVAMDLYFDSTSTQLAVKESLSLKEGLPEMEKVYDMICSPTVTDYKMVDDRIVVEGVVGCNIIYLVRGEGRHVGSFSEEIPFKTSLLIPGCKPTMKPEVDIDIENLDYVMLTKNEVEVKVNLECGVKLYDKITKEFIIKAEEIEEEIGGRKPSFTIYMVQPNDTLWKVAKRYCTTVDAIVKVNDIEDSDNIKPGMKLIITRIM